MALFFDRVAFKTATTGTGSVDVGNAISPAFLTPAEAGVSDSDSGIPYLILDGDDFEIGIGTYSTGTPDTFARDTVQVSKISGSVGTSKIDLSGEAVVRFGFGATELGEIATKVADAVTSTDVSTIVALTQEDYDELDPPDPDTLYIIKEDEE